MEVVDSNCGKDGELQLSARPVMAKRICQAKSAKENFSRILKDLMRAINQRSLPPATQKSLWKLLRVLPRFLFYVPIHCEKSRDVGGVAQRLRLFRDGHAKILWEQSHAFGITSTIYDPSSDDLEESKQERGGDDKQAQDYQRASSLQQDGDCYNM